MAKSTIRVVITMPGRIRYLKTFLSMYALEDKKLVLPFPRPAKCMPDVMNVTKPTAKAIPSIATKIVDNIELLSLIIPALVPALKLTVKLTLPVFSNIDPALSDISAGNASNNEE